MRIGMSLEYSDGGFASTVDTLVDYENAGLDLIGVREAYTFDAVSQLGYIAARTKRVEIASGILQLYTRTPTLTAMTAAGLDYVSNGRFVLGLGASNPQVVEGFHGVPYDAPLARTREIVDICRAVWRREKLVHDGKHYQVPLSVERGGSGLGKPLKLINHPLRANIPITLAAIGPKNVELAAEICEGWEPIFFHPEKAMDTWGDSLRDGYAKRSADLPPALDIVATCPLAIGDDVEGLYAFVKPVIALYVGGMGARGKNFYNDLAVRYGYPDEAKLIQDLYLDGKKEEAAAAVPDELVRAISLIGPEGFVKEQVAKLKAAGITTINVTPLAADAASRVKLVEQLRTIVDA